MKPLAPPEKSLYKTALGNLEAARKIISRPNRWIQNELAQDCNGEGCKPRSPEAISFCALGAVRHANGPGEKKALQILRQAAAVVIKQEDDSADVPRGNDKIFEVNDILGRKSTLLMFRIAIQMAKGIWKEKKKK